MTWARLDDGFREHPKSVAAGDAACWLWVCGLLWANRYLTDGRIPRHIVPRLLIKATEVTTQRLARKLVEVGLWDEADDGYQIHDYAGWNETREAVETKRAAQRQRVERWRRQRDGNALQPRYDTASPTCEGTDPVTPPHSSPLLSSHDPTDHVSPDTSRKARRSRSNEPLPFTVAQGLEAMEASAKGRFVSSPPTKGVAIRLVAVIRQFADIADWRLVGEYLAAGGRSWHTTPFAPSDVASAKWPELVQEARLWRDGGKPAQPAHGERSSIPKPASHAPARLKSDAELEVLRQLSLAAQTQEGQR